ncbi:MAG: hypothetical protein WC292_06095 [Clostridia bacterium]
MDGWKIKVKNFLAKLKTVKNIEIIIGIVIICIVALIYSTVTGVKTSAKKDESDIAQEEYASVTVLAEERLQNILSEIEGAGRVKVMITYDGEPELITAATTNRNTNTYNSDNGSTSTLTETITPIVVTANGKSELIIIKEKLPPIKGIVIVSEGASDIRVKLNLIRATAALMKVNANAIEVFTMK